MDFEESPRNRELLILGILLFLGLLTRFIGISYQSIWIDEGSTFYYSHYTWDAFLDANEPNSPVYYMVEGFFIDILGQTEFGIRFLSALAGALTVPLAYLLSMKLFNSRPAAVITAVLFLLSPMCLFYGQEARGYMLVLLIFMLQLYVLLYALETKRNLLWVIFAVLSAIQFSMQYTGMLATITLYLYILYRCFREAPEDRKRMTIQMLWSGILFIILIIPLMKLAYDTMVISAGHEKWGWCFVGLEYLVNSINDFLFGTLLSLVFFIIAVAGLFFCHRQQKDHFILLCIIILVPLLLSTVLSFSMNMTPRYILWAVTGFYLAIPYSLTVIDPKVLMSRKILAALSVAVIVVAVAVLPLYYTQVTKEDFRTGAKVLEENVRPGDLVLYATASENSIYASISFYYDPMDEGIDTRGISTNEELWAIADSGEYGNIYILILADYDPVDYLLHVDSPNCERICDAYRINVFRITGPLPH